MSIKKKATILVVEDQADTLVGLSERLRKAAELVEKATVGGTIEHGDPAWQCEWTRLDENLWAPDHLCIRNMAVAESLESTGSCALLDIRMELAEISDEVLQNITIRIHVRDTFGMSQYVGQAQADDFLYVRPEDALRGLHVSFSIEREVLDRLEANGSNSIHLILEDKDGEILDNVIGELRVNSC